jgi:hypothetical protein
MSEKKEKRSQAALPNLSAIKTYAFRVSVIRLKNRLDYPSNRERQNSAPNSLLPVWVRSIVRWEKLVKKKSQADHKMFGESCRIHLFIVVHTPRATGCLASHLRPQSWRSSAAEATATN